MITTTVVKLADILTLENNESLVDASQTYLMGGIYSYCRGTFVRGPLDGKDTTYKTFHRPRRGQIILSQLKGWEGALAYATTESEGLFFPPHNACFSVSERAEPGFVFWFLRQASVWNLLKNASRGMGARRDTVPIKMFLNLDIPLPSLPAQRYLVGLLEDVEKKTRQVQGLIQDISNDLLQVIRSIIWKSVENGGEVMTCRRFLKRRGCKVLVDPEQDYSFAGVYSFGRGVFCGGTKRGSEFSYRELTRVHTDDFVYPKLMAWEGALGVVPSECNGRFVSPEFPVFEIERSIVHPIVVDAFFKDPRVWPRLQSGSTGTNLRRKRLNPEQLLDLEFPVPNKADQAKIAALEILRRQVVERNSASLQALELLLPSLLNRVFGDKAFNVRNLLAISSCQNAA